MTLFFAIDLMRLSWIHWRCRLHTTVVTQYSWTISRFTVTLFSLSIYGSAVTVRFWQFHASTMTLFCYRIDLSVVNSLTLWIPFGSCDSVFVDDFKVYCYSVLAGNLWINCDVAFLRIPCVGHDCIFAIDLMRRSWIHWRCRFHVIAVTQYSLTIFKVYCYSVLAGDLWINRLIAFLTIPCVGHDNIFAIDLMRWLWIHWRCRLHTMVVTQYSWTISRFTVTLFSLPIYGSVMTVRFW